MYPADATPGHLLSVVPVDQLALLRRRQLQQKSAQQTITIKKTRTVSPKMPPPLPAQQQKVPLKPVLSQQPSLMSPKPSANQVRPTDRALDAEPKSNPRYTDAIRTQQQWLRQLQGR